MDSKIDIRAHKDGMQSHSVQEPPSLAEVEVADLDTQTPANRVKFSGSPELPPYKFPEGSDDISQDGSDSSDADSFILDLFQAERSGEGNLSWIMADHQDDIQMTSDECEKLKTELRSIGGANFMRKYTLDGEAEYTIKEVMYAFGYVLVS
jgi:hypothetical protein